MIIKSRTVRFCGGIILGLFGWLSISTLVLFSFGSPAVLVIAPSSNLLTKLPEDVKIVSISEHSITLASNSSNLARELVNAGAFLVLPSGVDGCVPFNG